MLRTSQTATRKPEGRLLTTAVCAAFLGAAGLGLAQQDGEPRIGETRDVLEKWVETKRLISKEKQQLQLSREVLDERIKLIEREIEALRGKIGEAEESIAEADKKRVELMDENEKLKAASASLGDVLASLEKGTKELLTRLPEPIRERVKPLSQRLPDNPEESDLSVSQRFQNVVGILNEVNKFHREITVTSEVRELSDGKSVEVTALYLGVGQGYYSGAKGTVAGIGTVSDDGQWTWIEANEAAPQIAQAIAILQNEQVASFVHVPVSVK
ncbi:MAG: DUF3450 family protein [Sumerlaeia bacterium]